MTAAKKTKTKASPRRETGAKRQTDNAKRSVRSAKPQHAAAKPKAQAKAAPAPAKKPVKKNLPPPVKTAKRTAPPAAAPIRKPVKKTVSTIHPPAPPHPVEHKAPARAASPADVKKPRFQKGDLEQFKAELLAMRERITGQSGSMRHAALQRNDEINPEEDGTDAFMRLQTLEQVGGQHRDIAKIDEALRSIEKGSYGICELCGELISKPRLAVLPFATNCIRCQAEMERMTRPGGRR
jgi:DnaK suppressor protein